MSIMSKSREPVKPQYELHEPVAFAVELNATFIRSTPGHVRNPAVKMLRWEDPEFRHWWKEQKAAPAKKAVSSASNLMAKT